MSTSSSTRRRRTARRGPSAQAYSDYLKSIAAGVDQRGKPLRRRTIDVEKQAAIILCQALEKIGDSYAALRFFRQRPSRRRILRRQRFSGAVESTDRAPHRPHRTRSRHAHGRGDSPRNTETGKGGSEQPAFVFDRATGGPTIATTGATPRIKSTPCRTRAKRCSKPSGAGSGHFV